MLEGFNYIMASVTVAFHVSSWLFKVERLPIR